MTTIEAVKQLLNEVLQLGDRVDGFNESTILLGGIPEFDSMAVISVITAMEEQFDFEVSDDEIDAEAFETLGSLVVFVEGKI